MFVAEKLSCVSGIPQEWPAQRKEIKHVQENRQKKKTNQKGESRSQAPHWEPEKKYQRDWIQINLFDFLGLVSHNDLQMQLSTGAKSPSRNL